MDEIKVVKVDRRNQNWTLYIGRAWAGLAASKWANPFHLNRDRQFDANERQRVLVLYEKYVRSRLDLMAALHEIDGQVLGCWCRPYSCHGDVLIKLRKEQCKIPPKGWWCSRGAGHEGPCAARPIGDITGGATG